MKFCITIDGPAGAGKSTIAKRLAKELDFFYIDTGAMYRSVTCASILYEISSDDENRLGDLAEKITHKFKGKELHYYINNLHIMPFIRSIPVNESVSEVSVHKRVRETLVDLQRNLSYDNPYNGTVMEGRDTGTVVLPQANLKIFLTASTEERIRRRIEQYEEQGFDVDYETIKKDLVKRDRIDSTRAISPLKIADDGIELDSTSLSIEEVIAKIKELIVSE
jgi:cytidylate kinase